MGYYTDFDLTIDGPNGKNDYPHVIKHLRDTCYEAKYALREDGRHSGNEIDWCDYEKDLVALSLNYPLFVFHLRGEGGWCGQGPDVWNAHFKNGEVQMCKAMITFGPCKFQADQGPNPETDPIKAYEAEHVPISSLPPHVQELVKKGLTS